MVFPYPPSVAKFYPVNRTNHAKQSEKQKDSAAWTAKWGGSRFILRHRPETPVPFTPLDIVDHPQTADPLLAFGKKKWL